MFTVRVFSGKEENYEFHVVNNELAMFIFEQATKCIDCSRIEIESFILGDRFVEWEYRKGLTLVDPRVHIEYDSRNGYSGTKLPDIRD